MTIKELYDISDKDEYVYEFEYEFENLPDYIDDDYSEIAWAVRDYELEEYILDEENKYIKATVWLSQAEWDEVAIERLDYWWVEYPYTPW